MSLKNRIQQQITECHTQKMFPMVVVIGGAAYQALKHEGEIQDHTSGVFCGVLAGLPVVYAEQETGFTVGAMRLD